MYGKCKFGDWDISDEIQKVINEAYKKEVY